MSSRPRLTVVVGDEAMSGGSPSRAGAAHGGVGGATGSAGHALHPDHPASAAAASFRIGSDGAFVSHDIAITPTGQASKRGSGRSYSVDPASFLPGPVLGRGASGVVQLATHAPSGTPVALKLISVLDAAKRQQVLREVALLFDSDCDALVSFHGAFIRPHDGLVALVLEYMDAGTLSALHARCPGGRLPEAAGAAVAFQLMWACSYLKVERRVHRDIKPSNVLLSATGAVKLSDFGLSQELAGSLGGAVSVVGTCKYMAPERILGGLGGSAAAAATATAAQQGPVASYPADVWAAGLVVFEVVTGLYPFHDASTATYIEMAEAIVEAPEVAVPAHLAGALSPEFIQFIAGALARDPARRLPADVLLGSPWFSRFGIRSLEDANGVMAGFLRALGPPSHQASAGGAAAAPAAAVPLLHVPGRQ